MHYYQFNIGDYAKRTRHLSNIEDLAYRRLIDLYYTNEEPIQNDIKKIARLIGLRENIEDIKEVLKDFFKLENDRWTNKRADEEIVFFHSKADTARANGKKGGRPKKTQSVILANPEITQSVILANPEITGSQANQQPITNNQQPITKKSTDLSTKAKEVFDYWCKVMGKKLEITKQTAKRKKAINARLKDYSVETIKLAIDNCSKDPFSMGKNDRNKPFNDIELICRNGEKLESFLDSDSIESEAARNRRVGMEWATEDEDND